MNTRTIIYIAAALALGLLAGYFLFKTPAAEHDHTTMDHPAGGAQAAEIWTCSMHPQIQQPQPGECPLCGMDLIPLVQSADADPTVLTMTEAAVALARVRTLTVGKRGADAGAIAAGGGAVLELGGRLAPDERTIAVEASAYGGRIDRLFVSFSGERVRPGQRIATVYSPDLVVAQEELLQAHRFADVNPDLAAAARAKLLNLEVSERQIEQLLATGEVTTNFPLYADESGTILEMKVEVGEYLKPGEALYTYTNLDQLWALFDAYEADLARIEPGDRIKFTVPSRPGQTYQARVSFIDPLLDPRTRTAAIRAEVNNRRGNLKPEMFIEGRIEVGLPPSATGNGGEALYVPRSAVLWTGPRSVAYVELPDTEVPTYEFREIAIGERLGDGYLVTDGLQSGDRVVVNGAFQLDAAAQLNNKASMMNRGVVIAGREPANVTTMVIPDYREETPPLFQKQLGRVVEAYLPLKDVMVASTVVAEDITEPMLAALAAVDMSLVTGDAHLYWMQQLNAVRDHTRALVARRDIAAQRQQFYFLSQALINAVTAFGVEGHYYNQHCPMAFDNKGGNWLSAEEQIKNPYFGDAMLHCGTVMEEF